MPVIEVLTSSAFHKYSLISTSVHSVFMFTFMFTLSVHRERVHLGIDNQ